MNRDPVLVLFAKVPLEGKVKTRLSPPLTSAQTTQIAKLLIEHSIKYACKYWPGQVELCLWPDVDNEFIRGLTDRYQFSVTTQTKGDLGDKMYAAMFEKTVTEAQVALIMGCDVVYCSEEVYLEAFNHLQNNRDVIGPTIDGGYYCIGVNRPERMMFKNVSWGSEQALAQTIESCKNCGIEFEFDLPVLRDLDSYDDLVVLSKQFPALKSYLI